MAQLKSVFLEYRYRTRPRPLRDYVFGYFAQTAAILSATAPLVNAGLRVAPLRQLCVRALGITSERAVPSFRRNRSARRSAAAGPSVLFMRDPLSHYVDGPVENAAFALLEWAGYRVRVLDVMGAGAALISKGFLSAARRHARRLLDDLGRLDPDGKLPVAVLEPSELSALREDFRSLLPGISDAAVQRFLQAQSVEQLLVRSGDFAQVRGGGEEQRVLLHPHCHERAATRVTETTDSELFASMGLLRKCGFAVELVEAGCCGMGGMFGYEAEHYELSQKIGGLKLFPAIAGAPDALVAATGGACRLHITQGTGRKAEHPLALAARALGLN